MSKITVSLIGIVSDVCYERNKITINLVNYIDSKVKSWNTLRDAIPKNVKRPFQLDNGGKPDKDGHVGSFWTILSPQNRRKKQILEYAKSLTGKSVVVSVNLKKYSFRGKTGEFQDGYSLMLNNIIEYEQF